jgi:hypothetical protein
MFFKGADHEFGVIHIVFDEHYEDRLTYHGVLLAGRMFSF